MAPRTEYLNVSKWSECFEQCKYEFLGMNLYQGMDTIQQHLKADRPRPDDLNSRSCFKILRISICLGQSVGPVRYNDCDTDRELEEL
jgi:hypothetical protein